MGVEVQITQKRSWVQRLCDQVCKGEGLGAIFGTKKGVTPSITFLIILEVIKCTKVRYVGLEVQITQKRSWVQGLCDPGTYRGRSYGNLGPKEECNTSYNFFSNSGSN